MKNIINSLYDLEERFNETNFNGKNRIALFDLDNTLIIGDIGDAVFAQLLLDGFPFPLSWKEYQAMCQKKPSTAYTEVVRAMEGLKIEYLIQVSKRVLLSEQDFLYIDGVQVQLPKPNFLMQEVIQLLRNWRYSIFVVSASNDISAKIAGSLLFDIPVNNIAGIKPIVYDKKLTRNLAEPIPIGIGKVAQYRLMAGDLMPIIVATDSILDLPLLQTCDAHGIAIIVGNNPEVYKTAKQELPLTVTIHQIPADYFLPFQQQHRVA